MKLLISIILLSMSSCVSNNKPTQKEVTSTEQTITPQFTAGPPTIIYKTSSNYNNKVPVLLSEDKTEIVSYPHPTDLKVAGRYLLPTFLSGGYLLDNRGINKNVAFLKLTYEEYSQLKEAPTLKELYSLIIDKDPLTELCDCGNKNNFTDIQNQLNKLIESKSLRTMCKTIK